MKKLLFALAAVAMLFTACGKENENENETTDNVIIYNDVTYHMQDVALYYDWDHQSAEFGCVSSEVGPLGDNEVYSSGFRIYTDMLNQTFDLTKLYCGQTQHDFQVLFYGESVNFGFDSGSEWYNGYIGFGENGVDYTEETIFKSGTLTITNDENGFVWALNGTLRNDDTVDIRLVIPEGWDFEPEPEPDEE